jgi:hypothetical protein
MQTAVEDYLSRLCCPPVITYNFDVDNLDWEGVGIINQTTFESILGVTTDQFLKVGNNIKSNILTVSVNTLDLHEMSITNVNYITLSGITTLNLNTNYLTEFNPNLPLPTSLQVLVLSNNQMTTSGYTASEPWANGMHTAPSGGVIYLNNNTDSASGTNLETILTSKGWTVTT